MVIWPPARGCALPRGGAGGWLGRAALYFDLSAAGGLALCSGACRAPLHGTVHLHAALRLSAGPA